MILSRRVHRSPSRTASYPVNSKLAPSSCTSSQPIASTTSTPPHAGRKHSSSRSMTWLIRSSSSTSSHSVPHAAPKSIRISEPKLSSSFEKSTSHRCGPLGSGATVVRTPQEALSYSHDAPEPTSEEEESQGDVPLQKTDETESMIIPPLPLSSTPLPPLQSISDKEGRRSSDASTSIPSSDPISHLHSSGSSSSVAHTSSSKPTLVARSCAPSHSVSAPPVDIDMSPPQPPFEPILLSSILDTTIDTSKLIVTLETCTATYRTLLRSLVSRPSHLSRYITSLLSPISETASIHSNASDASLAQHSSGFSSVFRDHLTSSGCLPRSLTGIHIFLDRPSAPYTYILAYLRFPLSTPEQPEALPRAVRLDTGLTSPACLEPLLELRDEASYLGLVDLERLCCRELRRFHLSRPNEDGCVSGGKTGSIYSFRTVVEEWEPPRREVQSSECQKSKAGPIARKSTSSSSSDIRDVSVWERGREGIQRGIKYEVGPPPPGWI